jgi:hypothetical protein
VLAEIALARVLYEWERELARVHKAAVESSDQHAWDLQHQLGCILLARSKRTLLRQLDYRAVIRCARDFYQTDISSGIEIYDPEFSGSWNDEVLAGIRGRTLQIGNFCELYTYAVHIPIDELPSVLWSTMKQPHNPILCAAAWGILCGEIVAQHGEIPVHVGWTICNKFRCAVNVAARQASLMQ